jgi:hypothetical protein
MSDACKEVFQDEKSGHAEQTMPIRRKTEEND